jgi:hypothetical protein
MVTIMTSLLADDGPPVLPHRSKSSITLGKRTGKNSGLELGEAAVLASTRDV